MTLLRYQELKLNFEQGKNTEITTAPKIILKLVKLQNSTFRKSWREKGMLMVSARNTNMYKIYKIATLYFQYFTAIGKQVSNFTNSKLHFLAVVIYITHSA